MKELPTALLQHVFELTQELPAQVVQSLVHSITTCSAGQWPEIRRRAQGTVAHSYYRDKIGALVDAWQSSAPLVPPTELGLAISTASYCAEATRRTQSLELVWTGPSSDAALRRTDQALLQLIDSAHHELIIVSFAVYNIPRVNTALIRAAKRGVHIRIVIESPNESAGKITYDGLKSLGKQVAAHADIYRWPLEKRSTNQEGKPGALHVKCAVADGHMLFISSANLTEYALTLNMEMGVLITGGQLPQQVAQHILAMIKDRTLVKGVPT